MWTRGRIASLLGETVCLQVLALGALYLSLDARIYAAIGVVPPRSEHSTTSETDKAFYESTTYVEQEIERMYGRPEPATTRQWGCFEKAVTNSHPYDDPFEDVSLDVKFTKPDGSVVSFWGFYDGEESAEPGQGGVWRIRFMPDQVGTWHYEARFSDGSGQESGVFFCMACPPGTVPSAGLSTVGSGGPITSPPGLISAYKNNPIWFGYKGGKAVLVRSFQVGDRFLADADNSLTGQTWSCAQREAFLDWAQKQGYNMLSIPNCFLSENNQGRGRGWNTPVLWDARRQQPDRGEYRRLEAILDDLAARGMLVYPLGGFFDRTSDIPTSEGKQDVYLRYTLARLGCYWNLLLNVGGPELPRQDTGYLNAVQVARLGCRISELDVSGFLLAVDSAPGDDPFQDAPWATFGVLRGPYTADPRQLSRVVLRNHEEPKPLYACDTLWAGYERNPPFSTSELRRCAYVLLMSGATINFGDMDGDFSSGFSGTLDPRQKVQARHDTLKNAWNCLARIPFWRLKPRQDLVDTGYCLADPGQRYLVYLERRGTVTVNIEKGSYQIAWINARNTEDVRKAGVIDSRRDLTSPQEDEDWLLSLVRVEIVAGAYRER